MSKTASFRALKSISYQALSINDAFRIVSGFHSFKLKQPLRSQDSYPLDVQWVNAPSKRKAFHANVHSHIRHGRLQEARTAVEKMLKRGVSVRSPTFHAVYMSLLDRIPGSRDPKKPPYAPQETIRPHRVQDMPYTIQDPAARNAYHLLVLSRDKCHPVNANMYLKLVKALVKIDEFLPATVLVRILIEDYIALRTLDFTLNLDVDSGSDPQTSFRRSQEAISHLRRIQWKRLSPDDTVHSLCIALLLRMKVRTIDEPTRLACTHSVLILGYQLIRRKLPVTNLRTLITLLFECPISPYQYGVGFLPVTTGWFCKRVLESIVKDLPTQQRRDDIDQPLIPLPAFDVGAYNALLQGMLKHWSSGLYLAHRVFDHMTGSVPRAQNAWIKEPWNSSRREIPVIPNEETYNILSYRPWVLQRVVRDEAERTRLERLYSKEDPSLAWGMRYLPKLVEVRARLTRSEKEKSPFERVTTPRPYESRLSSASYRGLASSLKEIVNRS